MKFKVTVELDKRTGNFRVRHTDKNGKRETDYTVGKYETAEVNGKSLVGKSLAKALAKKVKDKFYKKEFDEVDLTLEVEPLLEEFVEGRKTNNFSAKTIAHYEQSFAPFVLENDLKILGDVTNAKLKEWKSAMTKEGLSTNTITNRLSDVRTWINWLVEEEKLKESPFGKKMMPMKKDAEPKYYTAGEFKALDEALIKVGNHPTRLLCHLAHSAGLRKTEAMGVLWEDISWKTKTLEDGKTRISAELHLRKEVVKGKKRSRTIPLDQGLIALLGSRRSGLLCPFENVWSPDHYFQRARRLAKIAKDLDIHGLRHSFAKNMLQRGQTNLAGLQKLLGHATIISTMVYAQFEKEYFAEGVDRAYEERIREESLLEDKKTAEIGVL